MTYTNSLQALDLNYALGHRFFEIDLIWSSDEYLVLLHDWGEAGPVTRDAFLRGSTRGDLTSLTIDDLVAWLVEHPDAYLVSDVKIGNLAALHFLRFRYPHLCNRVIPQIYRGAEFDVVADLGFRHIILTLYRSELDDDEVVEFAAEHSLFAVTMPTRRALSSNLTDRLHEVGVAVYAHTVNDVDTVQDLMQRGVTGVYTDFLRPPK